MRGLILAAGEGKRAQKVTGSYLKCIFPIFSRENTLLGTLISQLHKAHIFNLVIVGGYRYTELQTFLHRFFSQPALATKYVLLDAKPECFQGPIFSFVRAEFEFASIDQCLLLPADTRFHPRLFHWLASLDLSFFPNKTIHVIYTDKSSVEMTDMTQIIKCNPEMQVSTILKYKKWKKTPESDVNSPKVMVPAIILPGSIFPVARQGVEKGFTQVIQILIDLLRNDQEWELIAHHFKADSWVFHDFDVPEDLLKIQKLLKLTQEEMF